ncbi:hypothetical protein [Streptomyces sp. NPDC008150]|uniref:hypothetical protein n=1 Tax=Streptomyces sp. NPDC008150 TaxID=3364816 RepID=UPI0036E060F0
MAFRGDERERVRSALAACRTALAASGGRASDSAIGKALGYHHETVRKWIGAERRPEPLFVRSLAELAGLDPARVLADIGWLPPREEGPGSGAEPFPPAVLTALTALGALDGLEDRLRTLPSAPPRPAPVRAAEAVLAQGPSAGRFRVALTHVRSGEVYPASSSLLAEFEPAADARPLSAPELAARALAAGLPDAGTEAARTGGNGGPDAPGPPKPARTANGTANGTATAVGPTATAAPVSGSLSAEEHARFGAELRLVTAGALRAAGEWSWQGEPGTSLWRGTARRWPAHLLVQNDRTGLARPAVSPRPLPSPRPMVVVGAVWSVAYAAALLAEALGWEHVPVSSASAVDRGRVVHSDPLDRRTGRLRGWAVVARHLADRHRAHDPWPAVVVVKPYVFDAEGPYADGLLSLLRDTPARIVYARPARAYVDWWEARRDLTALGGTPGPRWAAGTWQALERVEDVLRERRRHAGVPADSDLLLELPEPDEPPRARRAAWPGQLMDDQFRICWRVLEWLDQVANRGRASLLRDLRPSPVADNAGLLRFDQRVRELPAR